MLTFWRRNWDYHTSTLLMKSSWKCWSQKCKDNWKSNNIIFCQLHTESEWHTVPKIFFSEFIWQLISLFCVGFCLQRRNWLIYTNLASMVFWIKYKKTFLCFYSTFIGKYYFCCFLMCMDSIKNANGKYSFAIRSVYIFRSKNKSVFPFI